MGAAVIVEGISKQYRLTQPAKSLAELASFLIGKRGPSAQIFWALRDVSLIVEQGESVGLYGHNGGGKSTLLRIISGVTPANSGTVTVRGKVVPLIQLGTGFHPELSGRDNIYLNGLLLGLGRQQITACLEDIIAFAELEQFVDQPIKHYSSGMLMRLGFAIAVHSEPEILVVDEVLAVGDRDFQKKCLDWISAFQLNGGTMLFVSHSLDQAKRICHRIVYIEDGRIVREEPGELSVPVGH